MPLPAVSVVSGVGLGNVVGCKVAVRASGRKGVTVGVAFAGTVTNGPCATTCTTGLVVIPKGAKSNGKLHPSNARLITSRPMIKA